MEEFIMNQVIIRDVEKKDLPALKAIINESWRVERLIKNESTLEAALGIHLNQLLHSSTFGRVAVLDDKVIGFILGSLTGEIPKYRLIQEVDSASYAFDLLTAAEDEITNLTEFMSKTFQTYGQLIHNRKEDYDGYVEFFVVSEEARGLKIGKKLMDELFNYFQSHKAKSIYLYTDTSCNFGFYDYNGFTQRASQEITFDLTIGQEESTVFLYDYQLNH